VTLQHVFSRVDVLLMLQLLFVIIRALTTRTVAIVTEPLSAVTYEPPRLLQLLLRTVTMAAMV